mmetsp:Transcript_121696/g.378821  ORF Transcript_121696/g.378821 Transcript_121696/m.378821 type:complete len:303 (+) Transcript_121696:424-1332(+)
MRDRGAREPRVPGVAQGMRHARRVGGVALAGPLRHAGRRPGRPIAVANDRGATRGGRRGGPTRPQQPRSYPPKVALLAQVQDGRLRLPRGSAAGLLRSGASAARPRAPGGPRSQRAPLGAATPGATGDAAAGGTAGATARALVPGLCRGAGAPLPGLPRGGPGGRPGGVLLARQGAGVAVAGLCPGLAGSHLCHRGPAGLVARQHAQHVRLSGGRHRGGREAAATPEPWGLGAALAAVAPRAGSAGCHHAVMEAVRAARSGGWEAFALSGGGSRCPTQHAVWGSCLPGRRADACVHARAYVN